VRTVRHSAEYALSQMAVFYLVLCVIAVAFVLAVATPALWILYGREDMRSSRRVYESI